MVGSMNCLDRFQYCYGGESSHYGGSGSGHHTLTGVPSAAASNGDLIHDRIPEEGGSASGGSSSSRQGSEETDSPRKVIREIIV